MTLVLDGFPLRNPTVEDFKDWWLSQGTPIAPPFENAVFFTEMTYAIVLFRHGIFQVEMYLIKEDTVSPTHNHPGVDSCFYYLTGNVEFGDAQGMFRDLSKMQGAQENGLHRLYGQTLSIGETDHSVRCFKNGAYLSFEKWNTGKPTAVAINWAGESVGKEHDKIIKLKVGV